MNAYKANLRPRMKPNEPGKHHIFRTILISFAFLSALAALTYYNIAVPVILKNSLIPEKVKLFGFIEQKTIIGFIMTIDNILAVSLQPLFGNLSDRTESKIGRRMPYLVIGIIGSALFFGFTPLFQILSGFIVMLFAYNIMMAFYRGPALSIVADYTEEEHRSSASGLQQLIANIGTIIAFILPIVIGFFISDEMDAAARDVLISRIGFPFISITMLICLLVVFFTIRETPTGKGFMRIADQNIRMDSQNFKIFHEEEPLDQEEKVKKRRGRYFFKVFRKENRNILMLLLSVLAWFTGFGVVEAFFTLLGTDYFGLSVDTTSLLGMVYPVSMIASSLPTGLIGKRYGRKKTMYICLFSLIGLLSIIAFIIIPLKAPIALAVAMFFVGFFWMGVIVNTFPILWSLCPDDEKSTYTGIYYTFNQTAAILGPVLLGVIFDLAAPSMGENQYIFLYLFILICIIIATALFSKVKGGEVFGEEEEQTAEIEYEEEDYEDEFDDLPEEDEYLEEVEEEPVAYLDSEDEAVESYIDEMEEDSTAEAVESYIDEMEEEDSDLTEQTDVAEEIVEEEQGEETSLLETVPETDEATD